MLKLKYRLLLFLIYTFIGVTVFASNLNPIGILTPEEFGAKRDGNHDDTYAIQKAIDSLVVIGGGTICFASGTYLVKTLRLGPKVSLVGTGNGTTIIKQVKGYNEHCLVVRNITAALKISDLTILGNDKNSGIYFEASGGFGENHQYLYTNTSKWEKSQAYKWIKIDNVCVYHFDTGLEIEKWGFNINICNSTFSHCGNGVVMRCTDSSMYNCYITNNKKDGLHISGSNNKISNVKSIFNGGSSPRTSGAFVIHGSRNQLINCESQDNRCKGFYIGGQYNLVSNCISNTDGYIVSKPYNPQNMACGFRIKGLYNSFVNCEVTSYTDKYGAVYYTPIMVDDEVSHYYQNIFENIKVLISPDKVFFHEPLKNVQTLASKNNVYKVQLRTINDSKYFVNETKENSNIIESINCDLTSICILSDFLCYKSGNILSINGERGFTVGILDRMLYFCWQGEKKAELKLDDDVILDKEDIRLIVSVYSYLGKEFVLINCFVKTLERGWIKKVISKTVDLPITSFDKADVKVGDTFIPIKRIAISNTPMPESVYLPYSNTNNLYKTSYIYIDADSYCK